jgi:chemotaxis protein methyltransferase CheR
MINKSSAFAMTSLSQLFVSQHLPMKSSTQPFVNLIATTLGLRVREQEETMLMYKLQKRVQTLGLPSLEAYYQLLMSGHDSIVKDAEWRELIDALTVNESYFFRDQGQFALLKNRVLPEFMRAKQYLSDPGRTIRVWSAGCSTGEEAYSLAILLKELIPPTQCWNILVLGTDINELALAQAKQGIYSDWSFRSVKPEIQKKYFRSHRRGWEVDPAIRSMVTFELGNLVQDSYPNAHSKIHNFDLILCRNVFIYFNAAAIASVLDRFYQALAPNGYLMTGHTELHGQNLGQFQVKTFPESVLYQRQTQYSQAVLLHPHVMRPPGLLTMGVAKTQSPTESGNLEGNVEFRLTESISLSNNVSESLSLPALAATSDKDSNLTHPDSSIEPSQLATIAVSDVVALLHNKAYTQAIEIAKQLIAQSPQCFQVYCLMAEAYANSGEYTNAMQACQQALQLNPFAVEPVYLLAQISQEQGDFEEARNLLRRVIYLAPTSVYAYFELGCLYEQQGNIAKAHKNWRSAFNGLQQLAPETTVDCQNRLTAAELQLVIQQKLNQQTPI